MATGILERVDAKHWRLIVERDDHDTWEVFEGSLRLMLDVVDDLSIDLREVRLTEDAQG
jgi:hypothetical protein